jgi:hypothetical protein
MSSGNAARSEVPLFSRKAGIRLELLTEPRSGGAGEDPFLRLNDSGRFSSVLLGRAAAGTDTTLRPIAFKIQRSSYRPVESAVLGWLANTDLDLLWERKRSRLIAAASGEVVQLLDLGDEGFLQKPVTFCTEVGEYFHPPCPRCGGLLADCRDDGLLRDSGLPAYSEGRARYIHCPACARAGGPITFYTHSLEEDERPAPSTIIRRRSELYRDLQALLGPGAPAAAAGLEETIPCFTCEHRGECYPGAPEGEAIPAESRLVPLSYYEFRLLPLEALELHFDELSDLLGGADWAEVRARAVEQAGAAGRERLLQPLERALASPFQWIHANDETGLFAVEALRLKLIAFTQLCRGLREHHARSGKPHLDLGPSSAMARFVPPGEGLPARWGFQVKLLDPGGAHVFRAAGHDPERDGEILIPALDAPEEYISPLIREAAFGREEPMRIALQRAAEGGAGQAFEAEASSPKARHWAHQPGDAVRVLPGARAGWLEGSPLWGTVTGSAKGGFTLSLRAPGGKQPPASFKTPAAFDASVAFYRRFHVPCDLHGLGMLLLRAVVVNDAQDSFTVEAAVRRMLAKVAEALGPPANRHDPARVAGLIQWQLGVERAIFRREAVLYTRQLRRETTAGMSVEIASAPPPAGIVPERLWSDILLLAFRLCSSVPGFSYAAHSADFDPARPEALMDRVLEDLGAINRRVHAELFAREERDREIARACDEVLAELTRRELGAVLSGGTTKASEGPGQRASP